MANYAIVKSGTVINICLWDGVTPWSPPTGTSVVLDSTGLVGIGWAYDGTSFLPT